jgi:hypothetical protein
MAASECLSLEIKKTKELFREDDNNNYSSRNEASCKNRERETKGPREGKARSCGEAVRI